VEVAGGGGGGDLRGKVIGKNRQTQTSMDNVRTNNTTYERRLTTRKRKKYRAMLASVVCWGFMGGGEAYLRGGGGITHVGEGRGEVTTE